jgi:hypothetical protein
MFEGPKVFEWSCRLVGGAATFPALTMIYATFSKGHSKSQKAVTDTSAESFPNEGSAEMGPAPTRVAPKRSWAEGVSDDISRNYVWRSV